MKVGIITFHASHNYGSMLQAYALQQTVLSLGHRCEIIDLRTDVQKKVYQPFLMQKGWIKKIKALRYPFLAMADVRKYKMFEDFMRQRYILTTELYTSVEELKNADFDFDCYISGSDQIWNTSCVDFSTAYFLDFVCHGKRIAYAPSMGAIPREQVEHGFDSFISDCLSKYSAISVREEDTAMRVREITECDVKITVDPTLLLSPSTWLEIAGPQPLIKGNYVLLYAPWYENYQELYEQAATFAEKNNITVVCTIPSAYNKWRRNKYFEYHIAVGPLEFLNLIKFSQYVLSGSFHAIVFSLIFGKSFYAYKGMDDGRISQILKLTELEKLAEMPESLQSAYVGNRIQKLWPILESSRLFLINALQ